jgi:PAS domain S-box-containing protein
VPSLGNVVAVAEQLLGRLGKGAPEIIELRAQAHEEGGEIDTARFWQRVAKAMRYMLSNDPDYIAPGKGPRPIVLPEAVYRDVFVNLPEASLLLQPNLVIVSVNRVYLELSRMREEALIGADLFEVFPDNPAQAEGHGESGKPDRMPLMRYDVRNPAGQFEERWWETVNTPVHDNNGRLNLILHQTREVTDIVHRQAAAR